MIKGAIQIKVLNKIILRNLVKNKKRTLSILLGIVIVNVAIFSILLLLSSYQQYLIKSVRRTDNWDTKISNITYKDYKQLNNLNQIKEISKTHNMGIMNIPSSGITSIYVELYSYDENSMQNLLATNIKAGRLPQNSNEIAISTISDSEDIYLAQETYKLGDKFTFKSGEISKEYNIVGILNSSKYDKSSITESIHGAITYMDESENTNESILDVFVSNKDIANTYDTAQEIVKMLNISNDNISYNEELLNYSLVSNSEFKNSFYLVGITLILIIVIASFMLIFTTLNITLNSRIKEFGTLRSVGCTKKQIRKIIFKEIFIITLIAIPISILISVGIVNIILYIIENLVSNLILQDQSIFVAGHTVPIKMYFSLSYLGIDILFIFITVFISALVPVVKISKISPIEAIKEINDIQVSNKKINKKLILSRILKYESSLGYKFIKRSRGNSSSIIMSLIICIVLFIVCSNYIENIYARAYNENRNYNYLAYVNNLQNSDELITNLKDRNLINSYYTRESITSLNLNIDLENVNKELLEFWNKEGSVQHIFYNESNPEIPLLTCTIFTIIEDETYNNFLDNCGIEKLEDGECILLNNINLPQYANFHVTNFKEGDNIALSITNLGNQDIQFQDEEINDAIDKDIDYNYSAIKNIDLKIKSIENNFHGYFNYSVINDLYASPIAIFVNKNTLDDINQKMTIEQRNFFNTSNGFENNSDIRVYINSSNPTGIEEYINKYDTSEISGINYQKEIESNNNKRLIMGIFLYSFIGLIAISCILNIFNIIYSNIQLRKRNFAILKSLGMTKRQLNKMLRFECFYYCIKALLIGITLGILIFILIYKIEYEINNHFLFSMFISWQNILLCIIFVLLVVFTSMSISKNTIKYENLIEIIKNLES